VKITESKSFLSKKARKIRTNLKLINGSRTRFFGWFEKFGTKSRYKPKFVKGEWLDYDKTILITSITDMDGISYAITFG
jgi:hypothetical protein